MAFQQFKLDKSVNQSRGIFDKYIYNPDNNDLISDIITPDYFGRSRFINDEEWIGSIIEVSASDGYAILRIVNGGTVTLYDSTSGGGINVPWGSITGLITDQTDLQQQFTDSKSASVLIINSLDDLNEHAPVSDGRHQLQDNKLYEFGDNVTTGNGFAGGAASGFTSRNIAGPVLTYTGTDPMLSLTDQSFFMSQFAFACPLAAVFDYKQPTGTQGTIGISQVNCYACDSLGIIDNADQLYIDTFNVFTANNGFTLAGATRWQILTVFRMSIDTTNAGLKAFDLGTSVHNTLEISNLIVNGVLGTVAIAGAANSANININAVATISSCEYSTGVEALEGITGDDVGYDFQNVTGVINSKVIGHCYIVTPETTVTSQGVDIQVAGTFVEGAEVSQASSSVDGVITALNRIERRGTVNTTIDVDKVGGGNDDYLFKIKKDIGGTGTNIVDVDGAFTTITLTGGGSDQITIFGPTRFVSNDKFFVTVQAVGTNDDVIAVTQGFEVTE